MEAMGIVRDKTIRRLVGAAVATTLLACSETAAEPATTAATTVPATTVPATTSPATTLPATTVPATTSTSTTTTPASTSTSTSTTIPARESFEVGRSVEGRPIVAERIGGPGGRRVLVIGVIHGNETDGVQIVDELRRRGPTEGVELWLVESMNPDGQAADDRHNANDVDLNRNFPRGWEPFGQPGDGEYAGAGPASEPETQAIVGLISFLRPDITIWYHQDLYVVSPGTGRDGRIRARYAELSGLPLGPITGGHYTGVAATWARNEVAGDDGAAFIVELGAATSPDEVRRHADAVLTIAVEG